MSCHYTGSGGGALNDYGKGVFASELAARDFTSKTPDEMGESSGFLGKTELPWWIRPGVKYRGLWFRRNVFDSNKTDRIFTMQFDLDFAFMLDRSQKYVLVTNLGYVPTPTRFKTSTEPDPANAVFRQFYLRWMPARGWFVYGGIFDKFYGLKHPDHTAVNRGDMGLGMSDQTHGVAVQRNTENWDATAHVFVGNLSQEAELRQQGITATGEYFLDLTTAIGGSALMSSSKIKSETRLGVHTRLGFDKGKSLILELGYRGDKSKDMSLTNAQDLKGLYAYMQNLIEFRQGYSFLTTYQYKKPDLSSSNSNEVNKLGVGILAFPMMRTEVRGEIVNTRTVAAENTSQDEWNFLGQVHISW